MRYPKPARHIITAVDAEGRQVPAAYRTTCQWPDDPGSAFSQLNFPEGVRWFTKTQRQEGYEVIVEDLDEVPDEMVPYWMLVRLSDLMPPARRKEFGELGSLAVRRAQQLQAGEIAERAGDRLFVAAAPDDDEVLELVFARGRPLIFARAGEEWVRSEGIGDHDYQSYRMVAVGDRVIPIYDERRASGRPISLSELRGLGLIAE